MKRPITDRQVKAVFDAYPPKLRQRLMSLRDMIFAAALDVGVGDLVETLKWRQPAYFPERPRTGSTIRIDTMRNSAETYAMYFHCQTTLVAAFREMYPRKFVFEGNRAILFTAEQAIPEDELKHCISLALTYHTRERERCGKPLAGSAPFQRSEVQ